MASIWPNKGTAWTGLNPTPTPGYSYNDLNYIIKIAGISGVWVIL